MILTFRHTNRTAIQNVSAFHVRENEKKKFFFLHQNLLTIGVDEFLKFSNSYHNTYRVVYEDLVNMIFSLRKKRRLRFSIQNYLEHY